MGRPCILLVDDEPNILRTLAGTLRVEGYETETAATGTAALSAVDRRSFDAILLDVMLPPPDGLEVLRRVRAQGLETPVIVMSGHGTIETAVEAVRLGAQDFLEKPLSTEKLLVTLANVLRLQRALAENRELRRLDGVSSLLGESVAMRTLREQVRLAATASAPVLVTGERGTGKELVARAIHEASRRAREPLVKMNCAAVPSELIESELFGHEAGSFTGATRRRQGRFEQAHGGTLFLDEVGDMPSAMQSKLLRVLQEGEIERVGGRETLRVDVRIVAATNRDLAADAANGRFREDLHDRLHVVPITVPPLRVRREDVPALVHAFLPIACERNDRRPKSLDPAAMAALSRHAFPGNVRELRNLVERLVILVPGDRIEEEHVRSALAGPGPAPTATASVYRPGVPLRELLDAVEKDLLERALEHHRGHATHAARDLGLERSHFYKKLRAHGLRRGGDDDEGDGDR